MNYKTLCIIPAYNEEKNIEKVLNNLSIFNKKNNNLISEIVVINDGSTDKTEEVIKKFIQSQKDTKITLLNHHINRDQGASLETGNTYARKNRAEIVIHFDADGQHYEEDIKDAISLLKKENYDVILGSRFLGKKSNIPLLKKKVLMPLAKIVNKIFFNINLSDPQSGFRVFNKKALNKLIITQDGMAHCSEILYKIFQNNLKVKETPITVTYHEFGQNLSGGIRIVKDIILKKIIN